MKKIKRILGWQNLKSAFKGNIVDLPMFLILVFASGWMLFTDFSNDALPAFIVFIMFFMYFRIGYWKRIAKGYYEDLRNLRSNGELANLINKSESKEQINEILDSYIENNPSNPPMRNI